MRSLLLALVVLLSADAALASGAAWPGKRVVVRDYTSAEWRPLVQQAVADFNRVMPKRVPRLVLRDGPARPCERVRAREDRGQITVCLTTRTGGDAIYRVQRHAVVSARVRLAPDEDEPGQTLCHELMHAVTDIGDREGATVVPTFWDDDSCVWGSTLTAPGPLDARYAARVYRQHGSHRHGPHHHRH